MMSAVRLWRELAQQLDEIDGARPHAREAIGTWALMFAFATLLLLAAITSGEAS